MNGLALCAGIGGLELGIKRAMSAYKTVCYIENNPYAAAVLIERMEEKAICQAPIWDSIETFPCSDWIGLVDIITAGFPCQPFSIAGTKRGTSDERWLWPHIERIISEISPWRIFLENVPGFIPLGLESVLMSLAKMGYYARWCCVPARAVGAPHERERFFLLAYSNKAGLQEPWIQSGFETSFSKFTDDTGWTSEPKMARMANGIPSRVDRIKCLGNAVVPAQAELAWRILTK